MAALTSVVTLAVAPPAGSQADQGDRSTVSDALEVVSPHEVVGPAEIARRLAASTFTRSDTVVVARQDGFADSLAAGVLQADAPLLLTGPTLSSANVATIRELGASRAIVLGGPAAVPDAVATALQAEGLQVERLAGPDRVTTAVRIAEFAVPQTDTAILVRGAGVEGGRPEAAYADSLAAGGLAAATGWPVLLTGGDELAPATREHLTGGTFTDVVIVGGTAAVTESAESALPEGLDVIRLAGPTRELTAVAVADFRQTLDGPPDEVIVVDDRHWVGGFAAAARSGRNGAPIVLADIVGLDLFLDDLDAPALTCVTSRRLCELARVASGRPARADLLVAPDPETTLPEDGVSVQALDGAHTIDVGGSCVPAGTVELVQGVPMRLAASSELPSVSCELTLTTTLPGGVVQREVLRFGTQAEALRESPIETTVEARAGDWLWVFGACGRLIDPLGRDITHACPRDRAVPVELVGTYTVAASGEDSNADRGYTLYRGQERLHLVAGDVVQWRSDPTLGSPVVHLLDPDGQEVAVQRSTHQYESPDGLPAGDYFLDQALVTQTGPHVPFVRRGTASRTVTNPDRFTTSTTVGPGEVRWWEGSRGQVITIGRGGCSDINALGCGSARMFAPDGQLLAGTGVDFAATSGPVLVPQDGMYAVASGGLDPVTVSVDVHDPPVVELPVAIDTAGWDLLVFDGVAGTTVDLELADVGNQAAPFCPELAVLAADLTLVGEATPGQDSCRVIEGTVTLPADGRYLLAARSVDGQMRVATS